MNIINNNKIRLFNEKIINLYDKNIDKDYNQNYNKNLIKFKLNNIFYNNDSIIEFINNDAELLLYIIQKCNQYDINYQNNLNDLFFKFINIIYSEKLRNIK